MSSFKNADSQRWARLEALPGRVFKLAFWALLLVMLCTTLIRWTFEDTSISVRPFTAYVEGDNADGLGQAVTDALVYEIIDLGDQLEARTIWQGLDLIPPVGLKVIGSHGIEKIGSVSISGMQLPAGELILALHNLWPLGPERTLLTGSVRRYVRANGSAQFRITARRELNGSIANQWQADGKVKSGESFEGVVSNLAYQITLELTDRVGTDSWRSFKAFTEGQGLLNAYRKTGTEEAFSLAADVLDAAIDEDSTFVRPWYALGLLNYWDAFYSGPSSNSILRPRIQDIKGERREAAAEAFQAVLRHAQTDREKAAGHFGMGLLEVDTSGIAEHQRTFPNADKGLLTALMTLRFPGAKEGWGEDWQETVEEFRTMEYEDSPEGPPEGKSMLEKELNWTDGQATHDLEQAIKLDPAFLAPHVVLAFHHEEMKRWDAARDVLTAAIKHRALDHTERERLRKELRNLDRKRKEAATVLKSKAGTGP